MRALEEKGTTMRLAIVQTNATFGENEVNIHTAIERMREVPADLYVLPELFNTGYNFTTLDEVGRVAEKSDGATYRAMVELAQRNSCYIAYGFAERANQIYNSAALVGPLGLLGILVHQTINRRPLMPGIHGHVVRDPDAVGPFMVPIVAGPFQAVGFAVIMVGLCPMLDELLV